MAHFATQECVLPIQGGLGASGRGFCSEFLLAGGTPLRGLYSTEAPGTEHFPASHLLSVLTSSIKHLLGRGGGRGH